MEGGWDGGFGIERGSGTVLDILSRPGFFGDWGLTAILTSDLGGLGT